MARTKETQAALAAVTAAANTAKQASARTSAAAAPTADVVHSRIRQAEATVPPRPTVTCGGFSII
jgi:hypothetical protein